MIFSGLCNRRGRHIGGAWACWLYRAWRSGWFSSFHSSSRLDLIWQYSVNIKNTAYIFLGHMIFSNGKTCNIQSLPYLVWLLKFFPFPLLFSFFFCLLFFFVFKEERERREGEVGGGRCFIVAFYIFLCEVGLQL